MSDQESDVKLLVQWAAAQGARCQVIAIEHIVFDPRVRLKCQVPLCRNYGKSWMCPPHSPDPQVVQQAVGRYNSALLVQKPMQVDLEEVRRLTEGKDLNQLEDDPEYDRLMRRSLAEFTQLMGRLETEAARHGHRFATTFTSGPCALCESCVGPVGHCLHPFQARPSMEAVGIDVIATAEKAGMPIQYPATDRPVWTGLLLLE